MFIFTYVIISILVSDDEADTNEVAGSTVVPTVEESCKKKQKALDMSVSVFSVSFTYLLSQQFYGNFATLYVYYVLRICSYHVSCFLWIQDSDGRINNKQQISNDVSSFLTSTYAYTYFLGLLS